MIRFIDIRNQGAGYRFAFWDTIMDRFCTINDNQVFDTVDDLKEVFSLGNDYLDTYSFERFERLCAHWAFEEGEEDQFYYQDWEQ